MNDTRNSYGMTEEEWQQYLQQQDKREKEDRIAEEKMRAEQDAKDRNKPPTLSDLKWLRPDLYW